MSEYEKYFDTSDEQWMTQAYERADTNDERWMIEAYEKSEINNHKTETEDELIDLEELVSFLSRETEKAEWVVYLFEIETISHKLVSQQNDNGGQGVSHLLKPVLDAAEMCNDGLPQTSEVPEDHRPKPS